MNTSNKVHRRVGLCLCLFFFITFLLLPAEVDSFSPSHSQTHHLSMTTSSSSATTVVTPRKAQFLDEEDGRTDAPFSDSDIPINGNNDGASAFTTPPPPQPSVPPITPFFSKVLGNENIDSQTFFKEIWQTRPYVFGAKHSHSGDADDVDEYDSLITSSSNKNNNNGHNNNQAWDALLDLLEQTSFKDENEFLADPPQCMKHALPVHPQDMMGIYGLDLFASYLDGCSYVQNHADLLSPELAKLCEQFQYDLFPNVYANTYLTPPNSQTFLPHSDDRDVFVVQLVGQKNWIVYEHVPTYFPYEHEQVGKYGREVPSEVLDGPKSIDYNIQEGDILYIPRGHVHEARCSTDSMSFHVTIAVPTFDWTVAGMMAQATQSILSSNVELRKSILPMDAMGTTEDEQREYLRRQIDIAIETLREQVTVDAMLNNVHGRVYNHRQRSTPLRHSQMQEGLTRNGPRINLNTIVRWVCTASSTAATETSTADNDEHQQPQPQQPYIRDDVVDAIQVIQNKVQSDGAVYQISQLGSLMDDDTPNRTMVCNLTLVSWVVQCIRLGFMEIVE